MRRVRELRTSGKVVVPPAGQVLFDEPPGDCYIKYGYVIGDSTVSRRQARANQPSRSSDSSTACSAVDSKGWMAQVLLHRNSIPPIGTQLSKILRTSPSGSSTMRQ